MCLQNVVSQCEERVTCHTHFSECHQAAVEWLRSMTDRLTVYGVTLGDRHALANRLERIQVCCLKCVFIMYTVTCDIMRTIFLQLTKTFGSQILQNLKNLGLQRANLLILVPS